MSEPKRELERIRQELHEADKGLTDALDRRARALRDYIALRDANPEEYIALPRDEEVVESARQRLDAFPESSLEPVLREVLSASTAMIAPRTVAYLGPAGGFPHVAARQQFGASVTLHAGETIEDVFDAVARGRASYGVVPFETSTDGAVTMTLHCLADSEVKIRGEMTLPCSYHLMSATGNSTDIEKIYGAPQAVAACERSLRNHFPRATVLDVPSAEVAAQFAHEDHGAATVGTDIATEIYGLRVVNERIEDAHNTEIRFALIGQDFPPRTGTDRTIVAFSISDSPGALYHALQPFADREINLTRIESRPVQSATWRYLFFLETDGHVTDRAILTALEELRSFSRQVHILGSYPRPT